LYRFHSIFTEKAESYFVNGFVIADYDIPM